MRGPQRSDQTHDEDLKKRVQWSAIRRLLALAVPYRVILAVSGVLMLVSTGVQLALPILVRQAFNEVQKSGSVSRLDRDALVLVGLVLIGAIFGYIQFLISAYAGSRIMKDLRLSLFAHLQRLPVAYFDRTRTGDLISHLSNDVNQLQSTLTDDLVKLAGQLITLVGGMTVAIWINWRLTVVVVLVLAAMMLFFVITGRKLRRINRASLDALGAAMGTVSEALANIRLVKAFAREPHEDARAEARLHEVYHLNVKGSKWEGLMGSVAMGGFMVMVIGCGWYGGRGVLDGTFRVGDVAGFIFAIFVISSPMAQIASLYTRLQRAVGAADRLFAILDEPLEPPDSGLAQPFPIAKLSSAGTGSVVYRKVDFAYASGNPVLQRLDLVLPAGAVTAVVGASGAGKTTLSALLYRFYEPTGGDILIDGISIKDIKRDSLREHIGIVPQDTILFNGSIRENIRYGRLDASDREIEEAARSANVDEFVRAFPAGYDTVVGERGITLSGGQRQRVAIARALLKDPRILILDEATSALDNKSEALVREALDRLMQGRTTLVIAHRLTTVQNADQIAVLHDGKISEIGRHNDLLRQGGRYAELYELVTA